MSRGKRYSGDKKLNIKKVIAAIIAIAVVIMFCIVIGKLLENRPESKEKSFTLAYYTIFENGKWGVMDTKQNIIIQPSYEEMIIIPDSSKTIFICQDNVNYGTGTYTSKAVNQKNETLFGNYDKVEVIYNHDKNNNVWYEKNVLKVQKDGKYGLINLDGKVLVEPIYESIESVKGTTNSLVTVKDGKKGLIDNIGAVIIENNYLDITTLTEKYENGFIVKAENGKQGIVGYNKQVVLEPNYDEIKNVYGNGNYVVKQNGKWKIVDSEGNTYLEDKFEEVAQIQSGNVTAKVNGKWGILTLSGESKVEASYDSIHYAFSDCYIATKDGKYGMINTGNEMKLPFNYTNIMYQEEADFIRASKEDSQESELLNRNFEVKAKGIISEINMDKGYIKLREAEEYTYYNLKLEKKKSSEILTANTLFLSKKDGKYGYVNTKGVVVVDYIYDDGTEQNKYGYVAVKKDGKWGSLSQTGKVIVEPTYKLENNLVVDFIGSYYLAEDMNSNYYTK